MDLTIVGEIAALGTSCLWTFNSIFFSEAGKRIGSTSVNAFRIVFALGFLGAAHIVLIGSLLPIASGGQWLWVGASGIVGLGVGDFGLFAAFVTLGPRRTLLVMALSPIFAAIGAYIVLGETIPLPAIAGIGLTLAGVFAAILERDELSMEKPIPKKLKFQGIVLALVGAIGQGLGLVFAKKGILLDSSEILNPLSTTLIRMICGTLFVWTTTLIAGRLPDLRKAAKNLRGIRYTAAGAFIGPFMGVTLSMIAVTYTQAGIAQTLISLMPILIIPVVWILYKQRTSLRGIIGAFVATIGVTILFLV
ncbi:MAG: DMT family transporter [Candidatus Bathyarchaeota archaeon]|nr:DMT family transporter [Candidatus Bathyarchaeota archaeon]